MISSFLNQKNIKRLSVNDVMIISYILWPSIVKLSFNIRPKNCCNKFITLKSVSSLMDDPLSNLCRDIGRSDDVPAVNRGLLDQLQKHGPRVLKMFEKNVPKMFEKLFDNNFFITFERAQKLGGCPVVCYEIFELNFSKMIYNAITNKFSKIKENVSRHWNFWNSNTITVLK